MPIYTSTAKLLKRAMLSQPISGLTDAEIAATRNRAISVLGGMGYRVANISFTGEWYSDESMKERGIIQPSLYFLAKRLEYMSQCHVAYFCKEWENDRGCRIEHEAAEAYGLEIIYEE